MFGRKRRRYPRHIRQSIVFGAAVLLILTGLAAGNLIYDFFAITLAHKPGYLTSNSRLLAIAPIKNYDFDEQANLWGQTLTAGLTDRLSHHKAIRIVDKRSMKRLVDANFPQKEMFNTLQIDYLLDGGVMRVDDQVVVTLHLYESGSGESVWAQSFAALWSDNAEFLVELRETVYNQLDQRIFPHVKRLVEEGAERKRRVPDGEALKIYYEANKLLEQSSASSTMMPMLLLHQALRRQEDLLEAKVQILQIEYQQASRISGQMDSRWQGFSKKLDDLLALDSHQGLVYAMKADIAFKYRRNMPVAEIFYQQAISLIPSHADIRFAYAKFLVANGRFFDAWQQLYAGKRLNPLAYSVFDAVWIYTMSGEYALAEQELKKITPVAPVTPDYYIAAQQLYQSKGDEQQAFAHYISIFKLLGFTQSDLERCLAIYQSEGLAGVHMWLALDKQEQLDIGQYLPPLSTAYYLVAAGETEEAMKYLELAHQAKQSDLLWVKTDPRFAALHDTTEFIALMKQAGFLYPDEE